MGYEAIYSGAAYDLHGKAYYLTYTTKEERDAFIKYADKVQIPAYSLDNSELNALYTFSMLLRRLDPFEIALKIPGLHLMEVNVYYDQYGRMSGYEILSEKPVMDDPELSEIFQQAMGYQE